jgi:hypothetical protein
VPNLPNIANSSLFHVPFGDVSGALLNDQARLPGPIREMWNPGKTARSNLSGTRSTGPAADRATE